MISNTWVADFRALDRLAGTQCGVLTPDQLGAAGLNKGQVSYQVKKGAMRRMGGGIIALAGTEDGWEQRVAAAALAVYPTGAASHRSAARIWNFRSVDQVVEVSIRYPKRVTLHGVVVHRSVDLLTTDITWFNGIPVTAPERTLCDLGLIFPQSEVQRILRHAIATGLVNRRDVWSMRRRIGKPGRDGAGVIGRCLDALPHLAEYTESGVEVMLLEVCEVFDLPTPALQLPVVVADAHYRVDFAYPEQRILIEVDGKGSHTSPAQIAADGGRQNDLVAAGWRPVRFTYESLRDNPARCAQVLRDLLGL